MNLSKIIANEVGYDGQVKWDQTKPDGTPKKQLNIEKIKRIGWSPKIDLNEGIARTIEDFRNNYLLKT